MLQQVNGSKLIYKKILLNLRVFLSIKEDRHSQKFSPLSLLFHLLQSISEKDSLLDLN